MPSYDQSHLQSLAEEAYERRVSEEGGENGLKWNCHKNAAKLADIFEENDIEYTIVVGIIVGDPKMYESEYVHPIGDVSEEHYSRETPGVVSSSGLAKKFIKPSEISDYGVEHVWLEVPDDERENNWIVEPYAEMRGPHEYEPVATTVLPIDYVYVEGKPFLKNDLQSLVDNGFPAYS